MSSAPCSHIAYGGIDCIASSWSNDTSDSMS